MDSVPEIKIDWIGLKLKQGYHFFEPLVSIRRLKNRHLTVPIKPLEV